MIDPNKTYRTRDGRAVRIYATDGGITQKLVHGAVLYRGAWEVDTWDKFGCKKALVSCPTDLVEVTLADELRDQIPWEALRPEIRWAAMDMDGDWYGYTHKPKLYEVIWSADKGHRFNLTGVLMPTTDIDLWVEALVQRPEDT